MKKAKGVFLSLKPKKPNTSQHKRSGTHETALCFLSPFPKALSPAVLSVQSPHGTLRGADLRSFVLPLWFFPACFSNWGVGGWRCGRVDEEGLWITKPWHISSRSIQRSEDYASALRDPLWKFVQSKTNYSPLLNQGLWNAVCPWH